MVSPEAIDEAIDDVTITADEPKLFAYWQIMGKPVQIGTGTVEFEEGSQVKLVPASMLAPPGDTVPALTKQASVSDWTPVLITFELLARVLTALAHGQNAAGNLPPAPHILKKKLVIKSKPKPGTA